MIFREVGQNGLVLDDWFPLFIAVLVQIFMHIVLILGTFGTKNTKLFHYIQGCLSTVYYNASFYAIGIIQVVYGIEYCHYIIYMIIANSIIVFPFHEFLFYACHEAVPELSTDDENDLQAHHDKEENHSDRHELEFSEVESEKTDERESNASDDEHHNANNATKIELDENASENSQSIPDPLPADVRERKGQKHRDPLWKVILLAFCTPSNVCLLLGIIWNLTGWTMPVFLDTFTYDHEKALVSVGLFAIGAFMWNHPFFGGKPLEIIIFFVLHSFVMPAFALALCILFHLDSKISIIIILTHAMPCDVQGYSKALKYKMKLLSPTFTFFWNNLLVIPVLMLWVVFLNETNLFPIE